MTFVIRGLVTAAVVGLLALLARWYGVEHEVSQDLEREKRARERRQHPSWQHLFVKGFN
jgi:hypothetical protein